MKTVTIFQEEYNKFKAKKESIIDLESEEKFILEQCNLLRKACLASKSGRAVYQYQLSIDNLFDEAEAFVSLNEKNLHLRK